MLCVWMLSMLASLRRGYWCHLLRIICWVSLNRRWDQWSAFCFNFYPGDPKVGWGFYLFILCITTFSLRRSRLIIYALQRPAHKILRDTCWRVRMSSFRTRIRHKSGSPPIICLLIRYQIQRIVSSLKLCSSTLAPSLHFEFNYICFD